MNLSQLQSIFPNIRVYNDQEIQLENIKRGNQNFKSGDVFVAIQGNAWDGHSFIKQASSKASLILFQDAQEESHLVKNKINHCLVENTRESLAQLIAFLDRDLLKTFCFIGITGTNGKTSVSNFIEQGLLSINKLTGVIGTIDHHYADKVWDTSLTSPGAIELQSRIREMKSLGADTLAMEVSSHALDQHRVDALKFKGAIFTNLSQDHLDYHGDMESYFLAKTRLFTDLLADDSVVVINGDDSFGKRLLSSDKILANKLSFGKSETCDYHYKVLLQSLSGSELEVSYKNKKEILKISVLGAYNVENFVAALALLDQLHSDFSWNNFAEKLKPIPGRLERVENDKGVECFVDYAHTPDALEKLLETVCASNTKKAKVVVVFGAGGDRDKDKRPKMAKACESYADLAIVTSDNPRTEDPQKILEDIYKGFSSGFKSNVKMQADRKQAIQLAVDSAESGDIILVAGKGHEAYQEIDGVRHPFSDQEILKQILER